MELWFRSEPCDYLYPSNEVRTLPVCPTWLLAPGLRSQASKATPLPSRGLLLMAEAADKQVDKEVAAGILLVMVRKVENMHDEFVGRAGETSRQDANSISGVSLPEYKMLGESGQS